jgi:hypothetical protein
MEGVKSGRDGLHLGLGGRMGDGPDPVLSQPSTNLVNWPRISPEDSGELSAGKLGSRIGVDLSNLWFGFRPPSFTPACHARSRRLFHSLICWFQRSRMAF